MKKIILVLASLVSLSASASTLDCYGWRFAYKGKTDDRVYFLVLKDLKFVTVQRANDNMVLPKDRETLVEETKVSENVTGFGSNSELMSADKSLKISTDVFRETDQNGNVEFQLDGKEYNIHVQCDGLQNSKQLIRDYQKRQTKEQ